MFWGFSVPDLSCFFSANTVFVCLGRNRDTTLSNSGHHTVRTTIHSLVSQIILRSIDLVDRVSFLSFRYQAQVTLLTSLLRPTYGPDLEIGTVDGMQGREKEAVIISLVRSNETVRLSLLRSPRGV